MKHRKLMGLLTGLIIGIITMGVAQGQGTAPPVNEYTRKEKQNFQNVVKRLDPYGNFFLYMNTRDAIKSMDQLVDNMSKLVLTGVKADNPQMAPQAQMGVNVVNKLYRECGLRDVAGFGLTSLQTDKHFYRNKAFLYHDPGKDKGKLWTAMGAKPHKFDCQTFMPSTTAATVFTDMDLGMLWDWHLELIKATGNEGMVQMYTQRLEAMKQMAPVEELIKSTNGEMGFILCLDPKKPVTIPRPEGDLKFAEPSLAILIKVKDAKLRDFIYKMMAQGGDRMAHQEADVNGVKVRTYGLPVPLPMEVSLNFAVVDGYLVAASSKNLMAAIINTRKGTAKGLAASAEFAKLTKGLPKQGNMFHYVSPRLKDTAMQVQKALLAGQKGEDQEMSALVKAMLQQEEGVPFFSAAVGRTLPDGILMESNTSMNGSSAIMLQTAVVPAAIAAGIMLPALAKAREKARRVNCAGNLKQIGLACLMYSADFNGNYPESLSVLYEKKYLQAGKVYTCPSAKNATAPKNAKDLRDGKTSYLYFGNGLRDDNKNASKTVIACDKPANHGMKWINFLFADGHVQGTMASSLEDAARKRKWIIPGVAGKNPQEL